MTIKNKEYRRLSVWEKNCTHFHTWVNFLPEKNVIKGAYDARYVAEQFKSAAEKFEVAIFALSILDDHIHAVMGNPEGPKAISDVWRSVKGCIGNIGRKREIKPPYYIERVQYSAITDAAGLIKAVRYVNNNGKEDRHVSLFSIEGEYRYKDFDIADPNEWMKSAGLNPEELRGILFCRDEDLPKYLSAHRHTFAKKKHLFRVKGSEED